MPSLTLPRMAKGPITKRREAVTKPSTNELSCDALNLFRKFSPNASSRVSSESAEPISPPMSIDARMTRRAELFGSAASKVGDHNGERADAAPRAVIKPKTSVIRLCDFLVMRAPARMPRDAPIRIAPTLITVPTPANIV